jgi:hypothetical protein
VARTVSLRAVLRGAGAGGASMWLGGFGVSQLVQAVPKSSAATFKPSSTSAIASSDDVAYLTIAQASAMIASGAISPLELVDACLDRIERF